MTNCMKYHDLRDFLPLLEKQGELKRITLPVDPYLEMTEIADRTLRAGGPALLFENPKGYSMPVLCNLFGTPRRVALGMGQEDVTALREVGKLLAFLKEPEPPKGFRDLFDKLPQFKQVLNMPTKRLRGAPCQQKVLEGDAVDLLETLEDSYDLVFMDSAKSKYVVFLPQVLKRLNPGGLILIDDVFQGGDVAKPFEEIKRGQRAIYRGLHSLFDATLDSPDLTTSLLPLGDGLLMIRKK